MRKLLDRIPFRFVNLIYWLLLAYLIAALAWWYFELDQQNDRMLAFQQQQLFTTNLSKNSSPTITI